MCDLDSVGDPVLPVFVAVVPFFLKKMLKYIFKKTPQTLYKNPSKTNHFTPLPQASELPAAAAGETTGDFATIRAGDVGPGEMELFRVPWGEGRPEPDHLVFFSNNYFNLFFWLLGDFLDVLFNLFLEIHVFWILF